MTAGRLAAGLAFLFLLPAAAGAECAPNRVEIRGDFGVARFTVDVADDPAEQARGLMFVERMPASKGMIFLFPEPKRASFWMRNTLIPLDMLFAGPDGTILKIHENAVPLDETSIDGGDGVSAVLEINGGLASRLGIEEGDVLQHPGFDPAIAALPCD